MSQPAFQILLVSNDPKLLATLSSVLHADNIANSFGSLLTNRIWNAG